MNADLLPSLVHLVIAIVLAEALLLLLWRRAALRELGAHLLAGLALLLALRSVLAGDGPVAGMAWLARAGLAHGAALWRSTKTRRDR